MRAAPAVSCAIAQQELCTRAYRFGGSIPAFPAQWLYGLLRALPGENSSFASVARERLSLLANLTPALRRPNHTTSPYASAILVSHGIRVHRIPPRVRDDGRRPSFAVVTGALIALIVVDVKRNISSLTA